MESLKMSPAMQALLMKKQRAEAAIARQAAIEEVEMQISSLEAKKQEMLSGGKKRGPKPLAEMTPEERMKHDLAVALRREKKASAASSTTATASASADEDEKLEKPRARPPMTDEHKAKLKAGREAAATKRAAEKAEGGAEGEGEAEKEKRTYKSWNPWALEKEFETGHLFSVFYKEKETVLTGIWEAGRYFLCSELIAPCPEGWTAEKAAEKGYGVPIKWDSPTHAAALVKAAQGAPINKKNQGPDAGPADVKFRVAGKLVSVYA